MTREEIIELIRNELDISINISEVNEMHGVYHTVNVSVSFGGEVIAEDEDSLLIESKEGW